jgi:hypothetical protein
MLSDFKDELDRIFRYHKTAFVRAEERSLYGYVAVVTSESPPRLPSYNRQISDIYVLHNFTVTELWDVRYPDITAQG